MAMRVVQFVYNMKTGKMEMTQPQFFSLVKKI